MVGTLFCAHAADVRAFYAGFEAVGLQYGPGYRTLASSWGGALEALGRLHARQTHEGTAVHPADLDDALCVGALGVQGGEGEAGTRLPFAVDEARLQGTVGGLWAVRRRRLCQCEVLAWLSVRCTARRR